MAQAQATKNPFDPVEEEDMPTPKMGDVMHSPFDPWQERAGPLGFQADFRQAQEAAEQRKDIGGADLAGPAYADPKWKGVHPYAGPWEDERGMTQPELNLKAQYLRHQGAYGAYPRRAIRPEDIGSWEPEDTPVTGPTPPMGKGASDLPSDMTERSAMHYTTDKIVKGLDSPGGHTTPLDDVGDYLKYMDWAKKGGKNPINEEADYDLRGYYKAGGKLSPEGHLPDTYKKPWHPTFSDESKYSGPGNEGGHWIQDKKGNYIGFQPGPANLHYHSAEDIQKYFDENEKGIKVYWPPGLEAPTSTFDERFPRMIMEGPPSDEGSDLTPPPSKRKKK